jgi:hypothetical protein
MEIFYNFLKTSFKETLGNPLEKAPEVKFQIPKGVILNTKKVSEKKALKRKENIKEKIAEEKIITKTMQKEKVVKKNQKKQSINDQIRALMEAKQLQENQMKVNSAPGKPAFQNVVNSKEFSQNFAANIYKQQFNYQVKIVDKVFEKKIVEKPVKIEKIASNFPSKTIAKQVVAKEQAKPVQRSRGRPNGSTKKTKKISRKDTNADGLAQDHRPQMLVKKTRYELFLQRKKIVISELTSSAKKSSRLRIKAKIADRSEIESIYKVVHEIIDKENNEMGKDEYLHGFGLVQHNELTKEEVQLAKDQRSKENARKERYLELTGQLVKSKKVDAKFLKKV